MINKVKSDMSMGVGGGAMLLFENDEEIIYRYYNYDLSSSEHRNNERKYDGKIIIKKASINKNNIIPDLLKKNCILVENSPNSWSIIEKYDIAALSLIRRIIIDYEANGIFPDKIGYHK